MKITFDDDMLRRAQSAINDMGEVFEDDLKDEIAALAQLLDAARADPERRAGFLADLVRHCHEIRGQAGTYGYPLISEFASSDEWAGALIDGLYRSTLGRASDRAGRAYWIGILGLDSAFPQGIRWGRLRYGRLTRAAYQERLSSIPTLARKADRV